jgi:aldehyde dehydrogenase
MKSVGDADDAFFDKAVEGAVCFALNQGEYVQLLLVY